MGDFMKANLIVAMDREGLIGLDGQLPWQTHDAFRREDLTHFKNTTKGHPCIMGHRTFRSLSRRLVGRQEIVVSRSPALAVTHSTLILVANELSRAVEIAGGITPFVMGGATLYRQLLQRRQEWEGLSFVTVLRATIKVSEGQEATYFPLKPHDLAELGEQVSETTTAYANYLVYRR
jgi:dihydrofolate reductase